MILIETNYDNFESYLKGLSSKARKQYAYIKKHNQDLEYREISYDSELVKKYMDIWSKQLVRGNAIEWAFPIETVNNWADKGKIKVFSCDLGMQFIQKQQNFWECHPPMFSKEHNNRYLAKYMWFNLIKYAIENKLEPLNMGGGIDNWREMLKRRADYPNPAYKFVYVPKNAKLYPGLQRNFMIEQLGEEKYLYETI